MGETPGRRIETEGAFNIRDIGGYPTTDGRRVRWRTFFRADSMHRLTANDQQTLLGFGLRTVIDLRRTRELAELPNVFASSAEVNYRHHNLVGDEPLPYSIAAGTPADRIFAPTPPGSSIAKNRWARYWRSWLGGRSCLPFTTAPGARTGPG